MTSRSHRKLGKASLQTAETYHSLLHNHPTERFGTCHGCCWTSPSSVFASSELAFHFREICLLIYSVELNATSPRRVYTAVWLGKTPKTRRLPRPLWLCLWPAESNSSQFLSNVWITYVLLRRLCLP